MSRPAAIDERHQFKAARRKRCWRAVEGQEPLRDRLARAGAAARRAEAFSIQPAGVRR
jgi:hypothetical protein